MIEFYGWAAVRYQTHDTDLRLQDECWAKVEQYVSSVGMETIHLQRSNGLDALFVVGQHNHGADYVFDLFHWLAEHTPGSYGLLYAHDDESEHDNAFQVWRLRRGQVDTHADELLSPYIPTLEDPWDPSRDD